jgi:uncharacterized membrane protein YecN with MAPEG domain
MIMALLVIFNPMATWERIFRAQRSVIFIFCVSVLPLLALTSAAEGYRLISWDRAGDLKPLKPFAAGEAIIYEVAQLIVSVLVVFLGGKLIRALGETFHGRHTYTQAFTTAAYGLGPLFLLRFLDGVKDVSPWLSWSIGIILSLAALYHGVPRVMQPDPPHAFGLFLMSGMLLMFITGLARFVTFWYLHGKFPVLEAAVADLATRWHL